MNKIRVTYSGFISFFVGSSTIFTGLIFTLIVTRSLTQEEFGTWAVIGTLLGYVLLINPVISYWNTREFARGGKTGKTAITSSGFLGVLAFFVYLVIVFYYSEGIEVDQSILLFGAILVPLEFFRSTLIGIANGYKPQIEEYGMVTFEIAKIGLAILLVFYLDMGVIGVIITTFFSTLATVIILTINLRKHLVGNFQKKFVKKWLKLFWIPIYPQIPLTIQNLDIMFFTIFTGGVSGIAYWTAAFTVSRIVRNSRLVAKAVYPRILQGGSKEVFESNMLHVFYFAFPLSAIAIVFSRPGLFALNPIYEVAYPAAIILVPTIFLRTITEILGGVLQGFDKVDTEKNIQIKNYLKSALVKVPTLKIIHRVSYVGILAVFLFVFIEKNTSEVQLVIYWSLIALITQIPLTIYISHIIKKEINPKFQWKPILKYILSAVLVFTIISLLMDKFLVYSESIFVFLPNLIIFLIMGGLGYLGLTYMIDKNTKVLVKSILKKIKR